MLLFALLFGDIPAVLKRLIHALLPLDPHQLLLRNILARLDRYLIALLHTLLLLPELLDFDAVCLGQVLAGFREISPNFL